MFKRLFSQSSKGKEGVPQAPPSVVLSKDAIQGIVSCISNKKGIQPGQLVLAVQRVMSALNEHPVEFAGKTVDSMDVFLAMPKLGIDLSLNTLAERRDSQSK